MPNSLPFLGSLPNRSLPSNLIPFNEQLWKTEREKFVKRKIRKTIFSRGRFGLCCLMTPGLRKDIRRHVWPYFFKSSGGHSCYLKGSDRSCIPQHRLNGMHCSQYVISSNLTVLSERRAWQFYFIFESHKTFYSILSERYYVKPTEAWSSCKCPWMTATYDTNYLSLIK